MKQASLALAEHRPETISHAAALMSEQEAVFLEEPPDPDFAGMLAGDFSAAKDVMTRQAYGGQRRGVATPLLSSVMNYRCRLQNPESEGFGDVECDARLRVLLVPYGQILSKNQLQISPALGNHVGFVFVRAA